jgi:hypothetical protein
VNETQTDKLDNLLRLARQLYNAALQQYRDAWKYQNKSLNYYDQANQLIELPKREISRVQNRQPVNIVIEVLGVQRSTLFGWLARYRRGGCDALDVHKRDGRPPKLTTKMLQRRDFPQIC